MKHPKFQGQHRLAKVYLKQFGYISENKWKISICNIPEGKYDNVLIDEFSKEKNIFDLPFQDMDVKRFFETQSGKVENYFPTVISNIKNQNQITIRNDDFLCHFVPNLMCKTEPFRNFVNQLLKFPDTRKQLFEEITMFSGNKDDLINILKHIPTVKHLNIVMCSIMNYLKEVFSYFDKVVIKSPEYGWFTTDNPVYIDKNDANGCLIPIESEIYLPLSRDYCLFMFHNNSQKQSNSLRTLKKNRVNNIDFDLFESINSKIANNHYKYLIFPINMDSH